MSRFFPSSLLTTQAKTGKHPAAMNLLQSACSAFDSDHNDFIPWKSLCPGQTGDVQHCTCPGRGGTRVKWLLKYFKKNLNGPLFVCREVYPGTNNRVRKSSKVQGVPKKSSPCLRGHNSPKNGTKRTKVGWVLKSSGPQLSDGHWNFSFLTIGGWENWV